MQRPFAGALAKGEETSEAAASGDDPEGRLRGFDAFARETVRMTSEDPHGTMVLAWKCPHCFAENFRAVSAQVEVGRTIALVCRTCDAVTRETVWTRNLIADRRRRRLDAAWPR